MIGAWLTAQGLAAVEDAETGALGVLRFGGALP